MTAKEWLEKFDVDLSKYHGNVGNEYGIAIEKSDGSGWIFWGDEIEEITEIK